MSSEKEWVSRTRAPVKPSDDTRSRRVLVPSHRENAVRSHAARELQQVARRAGNRILQRYAQEDAFVAPEHVERAIDASSGSGAALDHTTRQGMESAFGADLSSVRIHNDAQADALSSDLSARAFTRGNDIYFAAGEYAPGSAAGQRLLAHELTHVEQQQDGFKLDVGSANDPAELEADAIADQVVQRLAGRFEPHGDDTLQRQEPDEEEEEVGMMRRQAEEDEEETVQT